MQVSHPVKKKEWKPGIIKSETNDEDQPTEQTFTHKIMTIKTE